MAVAIGTEQFERPPKMNARRSEIIKKYMEGIKDIDGIEPLLPYEPENYVYQMFGIPAEKRDELMIHLKSQGVATGCHYTPLSIQTLFKPYAGDCSYIEKEHNKFIALPLHTDLRDEEVKYVVEKIKEFEHGSVSSRTQ